MTVRFFPAFLVLLAAITGCTPPEIDNKSNDNEWRLPEALREVSALAVTESQTLLMVNDEQAVVYEFNPVTSEIKASFKLGRPLLGDFEGIAVMGPYVYLVNSEGFLFRASDDSFITIDTGLKDVCEVEGLHTGDGELLVLCKTPYRDEDKGHLLIFAFDVAAGALRPYLRIAYETLGISELNPSGLEVDAGNLYILAARQKQLLVLSQEGALVELRELVGHRQAEGIAILADGSLFIADEGKKSDGGLLTRYPPNRGI